MNVDDLSSNQRNVLSLAYYLLAGILLAAYIFNFVGPLVLVPFFLLVVTRILWIRRFWVPDS